eukprot:6073369-Prorocentrum_lima.AAC.1
MPMVQGCIAPASAMQRSVNAVGRNKCMGLAVSGRFGGEGLLGGQCPSLPTATHGLLVFSPMFLCFFEHPNTRAAKEK